MPEVKPDSTQTQGLLEQVAQGSRRVLKDRGVATQGSTNGGRTECTKRIPTSGRMRPGLHYVWLSARYGFPRCLASASVSWPGRLALAEGPKLFQQPVEFGLYLPQALIVIASFAPGTTG